MNYIYRKAFTLSEVLLALAIVGVISAMVVPGLMDGANRSMLSTQLKNTMTSLNDLAQEQVSGTATKKLKETDFANPATLLGRNFKFSHACSDDKKCWASTYKAVSGGTTVTMSQTGILMANGVAIQYELVEDPTSDENKYSEANPNEHYFGKFIVDVNGLDKPNILGRDFFEFMITDRGRIGDNLANEKTKAELLTACKDGSETTACPSYLELNNWKMDY